MQGWRQAGAAPLGTTQLQPWDPRAGAAGRGVRGHPGIHNGQNTGITLAQIACNGRGAHTKGCPMAFRAKSGLHPLQKTGRLQKQKITEEQVEQLNKENEEQNNEVNECVRVCLRMRMEQSLAIHDAKGSLLNITELPGSAGKLKAVYIEAIANCTTKN